MYKRQIIFSRINQLRDAEKLEYYWMGTIMKNLALQYLKEQDFIQLLTGDYDALDIPEFEESITIEELEIMIKMCIRDRLDYYQKLTTLYGQFRSVGVNYNQAVVALKSNFTEKKAYAMLAQLEKLTLELAAIGGEIVQLTREFQKKWSQK